MNCESKWTEKAYCRVHNPFVTGLFASAVHYCNTQVCDFSTRSSVIFARAFLRADEKVWKNKHATIKRHHKPGIYKQYET